MVVKHDDIIVALENFNNISSIMPEHSAKMGDVLIDLVKKYVAERTIYVLSEEERQACLEGNKLKAVKLYRGRTKRGLIDAKRTIEQLGGDLLVKSGKYVKQDGYLRYKDSQ